MAYLKADAVKAVLEDLGVLDRGGNVNTSDSNRVGLRFDAALETLTRADVVTIAPAAIETALFLPLVAYLVQECAPLFHKARDEALSARALDGLRTLAREGYTVTDTAVNRLAVKVLRAMGLSATGYPSTKELASVTARIDQGFRDLAARRVIVLADADQAEEVGAFDALTDWFVAQLGPEQGQQPGRLAGGARHPASPRTLALLEAEDRLRRIAAPDSLYPPQVVSYF